MNTLAAFPLLPGKSMLAPVVTLPTATATGGRASAARTGGDPEAWAARIEHSRRQYVRLILAKARAGDLGGSPEYCRAIIRQCEHELGQPSVATEAGRNRYVRSEVAELRASAAGYRKAAQCARLRRDLEDAQRYLATYRRREEIASLRRDLARLRGVA